MRREQGKEGKEQGLPRDPRRDVPLVDVGQENESTSAR